MYTRHYCRSGAFCPSECGLWWEHSFPHTAVSPDDPLYSDDVVSEAGSDESGPPLPPRCWGDETVPTPEGSTDYVAAWANMDNWIPVTSPAEDADSADARETGDSSPLSAEASPFYPANEEASNVEAQEESVYAAPEQQAAQISQLMEQQTGPEVDGNAHGNRDPRGTPQSDSQPLDSPPTTVLSAWEIAMGVLRLQMAGVQEAVKQT